MRIGLLVVALGLVGLALFTKWNFGEHAVCVLLAAGCFFGAARKAKAL